jgi:cupin 2 domain-containing protein
MLIYFNHHQELLLVFLFMAGILSGFVDAVAGGGGLISIPSLLLTGLPISTILGTNKFQSAVGTSFAVVKYYRSNLISFATVYKGLIMGFTGAVFGAYLANHISNRFMLYIIPFLMLFVFMINILNSKLGIRRGKKKINEILFFMIFGFIMGFYDAFFGPGTGNIWIMLITFFLGYTFLQASGYAKILNLKSNLFSLAIFAYYGHVNLKFAIIMACGQMIGGHTGASTVVINGSKFVRPFFLLVVFINVILTFYVLIFDNNSLLLS